MLNKLTSINIKQLNLVKFKTPADLLTQMNNTRTNFEAILPITIKHINMKKQIHLVIMVSGILLIACLKLNAQAPLKRYYLVVNNADNEFKVYINDVLIYEKCTEGDPTFRDATDITNILQLSEGTGFINKIRFLGINAASNWQGPWPLQHANTNPWHFKFCIVAVNQITKEEGYIIPVDASGPSPIEFQPHSYIVFDKTYELVKER